MAEVWIRGAEGSDREPIWRIFHAVVAPGDTYAFEPDMTRDEALAAWMAPGMDTFVAGDDADIHGTYIMKPNQRGPGAHVANCAYMVHPDAQGRGIGRAMAEHSLAAARERGYRAMQYNLVVATNTPAVRLWHRLGFAIAGTLPGAFRHPVHGEVDAYVMYRRLD